MSPDAGADFANWSTRNLVIQCSPVLTVTSLDLHLGHLCLDSQGPEIQVLQVVKFISLFERVVDLTIRGTPLLPRAYWGELDPHPVHVKNFSSNLIKRLCSLEKVRTISFYTLPLCMSEIDGLAVTLDEREDP